MDLTHWMDVEKLDGDALLLTCPEHGCGRRVIISDDAGVTIVDTGDFYSRHIASVGAVVMSAESSA